ncbi:hypothetical protein LNK15_14885, partial [Jeotgalicoccus huakuii]|nr:hypothetical protein [Jeotgalicoccus huakuii]
QKEFPWLKSSSTLATYNKIETTVTTVEARVISSGELRKFSVPHSAEPFVSTTAVLLTKVVSSNAIAHFNRTANLI